MAKNFKSYSTHEAAASCFNCGCDMLPVYWTKTKNAPGRGQFVQDCPTCQMGTYYDIKPANRRAA